MNEFRGNLYLFIDVADANERQSRPVARDDVFGPSGPGTLRWYMCGWALGKAARGNYCSRAHLSKLKTFSTFATAMSCIHKKRKDRPAERFFLVYQLEGRKTIVNSLEQIQQIDRAAEPTDGRADGEEQAVFDALAANVGKIVAANALALRRIVRLEGEAAARSRFSAATYERLCRTLLEAGIDMFPPCIEDLTQPAL